MATVNAPAARVALLEQIRSQFPALERRENGRPVAYFDCPGGTQTPRVVVDAMAEYLYHHNANTHWHYPTSAETDAIIADARAAMADFLGADAGEIAFGPNMTTLTFHVARALGRVWGAGDEVVVTQLDHHANIAPWTALERERGVQVRHVRLDPATGELERADLERSIGRRTRLVAIGGASNALGTVNDLPAIIAMARSVGALSFVDAVHSAPHVLPDFHALDCDMLACSAYKFYGPHVGVLAVRAAQVPLLDVPKLEPAPNEGPERLETGTQNHEGMAGAAAAVDFLAGLGTGADRRARLESAFHALHARSQSLFARMWQGLGEVRGVRRYGPPPDRPRTPTAAFTLEGVPSSEVASRLAARGVFVSHGDFYAATVVERLGLGDEGLVRAGCACYSSAEEVERLVEGVREIAGG